MKLNRTKILVIALVGITVILGGVALYIANRLQTQIQTPSSASTPNTPQYNFTGLPTTACSDVVTRLQLNSTSTLSETLSVTTGQAFQVRVAKTTGNATEPTGVISVQKPGGRVEQVSTNGEFNSTGYDTAGVYTFVGTKGSSCVTNYATLTITATTAAEPTCIEMKIGKSANSLAKLNTRDQALLLASTDTLTVTYTLKDVPVGESRKLHMFNGQNIKVNGNNAENNALSYNNVDSSIQKANAVAVTGSSNVTFTYTLAYADLFKADTTARTFVASPAETPQWASGEVPSLVKLAGAVKTATATANGSFELSCQGYVKKVNIVAATASSPNAICKDLLIGTSLTNQARKNTREAPLSVSAGSDIYITHTLNGLDATDRTRYLRIYNGQNKSKDDGSDNHNYTSYNSNDNAYQRSAGTAGTGTGDIKFTYKLTYAQLFKADTATLGFAQTPAETPQWASGQVPNYVKLAVPVKPFVTATNGSYDQNCIAYVKRADATVTLVNTSNAACVGMTIGKNGGTQSARKTRDNPLLVSSGDTINITHTLSGLSSTENYRTLRMYNAQNISTTGDNNLNSFTSYNDLAATYQTTQRVANVSNFDFKYTLTYDQLFKADTTALVKAATPAEKPQWASGQVPNLVKVAVPVKPFGTNLLGTFDANCLGYISRVSITLASTSGGTSGGTSGNGGSGTSGSGSNDDLPSTDISALNIFELLGGAIFLLGGITIMKYRSRFENI